MPKLMITTPAFDPRVCMETYESMVALDTCGMDVECYCPVGFGVEQARNKAAEKALELGADWMLCVDSDMVVPKDALRNMLEHDVDVCFGYCSRGSNTAETTICELGRSNYDARFTKEELHMLRDQGTYAYEVRGGGFGLALVRVTVFQRIAEPWFRFTFNRQGRKLSEDYHFCTQCRNARIKLYVDTRVDCGHVRQVVV